MKRTLLTVLITFLFSFLPLFFAQSQPPTPRSEKANEQRMEKTSKSDQNPAYKQNGTEQIPFVVKILPAPKDKGEADREAYDRNKKATNERWLMYSTFWLAVATTFLAFFTGYLWWFTLKLWKTTHAAFIATNRPRLRIRSLFSDSSMLPNRIYIANVGGSAATDIVVHAVFTRKKGNVREAPWIENLSKSIWHGPNKLAPGGQGMYELRSKADIAVDSIGDMTDITTHRKILSIIGKVRYRDANETERETGFGWGYDTGTGEFSKPEKDDQYNYED